MSLKFRQLLILSHLTSRNGVYSISHVKFSQRILHPAQVLHSRPVATQTAAVPRNEELIREVQNPRPRRISSVFGNVAEKSQGDRRVLGTDLDRVLAKMDIDVKRLGRVSLTDFMARLEDLKNSDKISSQAALLMIRCSGNLLVELKPEDRTALTEQLWKRLEAVGTRLDISHYNALLKVNLENNQKFDPTAFLKTLEQKGVEANRVTYQRLIAFYCQKGDIAGATQILEFMREKDFPINESVFNVLIQGYARAEDMENAIGILDLMRSSQLEPSATTYKNLLEAFAEKGDMAGLVKYIEDAEKRGVQLLDSDYMDLMYTLASKNHQEHIPQIFDKLRKSAGYFHDALNSSLRLLDVGADETAFRLLSTLTPPKELSERAGFGILFIRKLVRYNYPVKNVLRYMEELHAKEYNPFAMERACEAAFTAGRADYAMEIIQKMRDSGREIRVHYFWPIFAINRHKGDVKAVWDTLATMSELGVVPTLETLTEYVIPTLKGMSPEEIIDQFRVRFPMIPVVNPLAVYCLENGKIKEATKLLQEHNIRVNPTITMKPLAEGYLKNDNFADTEGLLKYLSFRTPEYDFGGQFLLSVINLSGAEDAIVLKALQHLASAKFKISPDVGNQIDAKFNGKTPEKIALLLDQLVSRDFRFRNIGSDEAEFGKHPRDMSIQELEEHLLELKSKNMNTRGVLRRLLVESARLRNVQRAEEIKAELEASKSDFSGAMYAQLMDMYVQTGDLEKATATLRAAETIDREFVIDAYKILNLAALMISKDKAGEALAVLEQYHIKRGRPLEMDGLERNIFRVLNAAAEKGDSVLVQRAWDQIQKMGSFMPTNLTCGPLVKVHIINNDIPAAMKAFGECVNNYQQSPWKGELMKRLIEAEDTTNLQIIMDLSNKIHGETNSLYDLAFAFIEAGRVKQAQKIFDTPGLRARHDRLESFCNRMLDNNRPGEIQSMLVATRDLFDVDRDVIFYHLIRMYGKLGEPDKALAVWTTMQEENVQASSRTLRSLANILREHKRDVPFDVPEEVQSRDDSVSPDEANLLKHVREDDPDSALEQKRLMDSKNQGLSVRGYSHLIEILLQKERVKEALNLTHEMLEKGNHPYPAVSKFLVNRLSRAGEIDVLEDLVSRFPEKLNAFMRLQSQIFSAYVNANRSEEILDQYERGERTHPMSISGLVQLLRTCPNLLLRTQVLADRFAQEGDFRPSLAVWNHLFSEGQFDEAKRLLEKHPAMSERLRALPICERAHEKNDVALLRKLIDTLREHSRPNVALAYSYLIGLHCHNRDYNSGLQVLKEAQDVAGLALHELRLTALRILERGLNEMGQPVPFKVPEIDRSSQGRNADRQLEYDEGDKERMK